MEEDVAKLSHSQDEGEFSYSLLDINRAGIPLMEIVSEPDLRSPEEARAYLISLRSILQYINVSTANMEEGNFRCDANISLKQFCDKELGPKVEIKNMNSFKAVYEAIQYEIKRQTKLKDADERILSETRGWVEEKGITVSQRSKEEIADYRYFPEPDLPPLEIDSTHIKNINEKLPELPSVKKTRLMDEYSLNDYDAEINPFGTEGNDQFDIGESFDDFGNDGYKDGSDEEWGFPRIMYNPNGEEGNHKYDIGEKFKDFGNDRIPDYQELGYNPDPVNDDYHQVKNPSGTEGNNLRDEFEEFIDEKVRIAQFTLTFKDSLFHYYTSSTKNNEFQYDDFLAKNVKYNSIQSKINKLIQSKIFTQLVIIISVI